MSAAQGSLPQCAHTSSAFLCLVYVTLSLPKRLMDPSQVHYQRLLATQQFCFVCACVYLVPDAGLE